MSLWSTIKNIFTGSPSAKSSTGSSTNKKLPEHVTAPVTKKASMDTVVRNTANIIAANKAKSDKQSSTPTIGADPRLPYVTKPFQFDKTVSPLNSTGAYSFNSVLDNRDPRRRALNILSQRRAQRRNSNSVATSWGELESRRNQAMWDRFYDREVKRAKDEAETFFGTRDITKTNQADILFTQHYDDKKLENYYGENYAQKFKPQLEAFKSLDLASKDEQDTEAYTKYVANIEEVFSGKYWYSGVSQKDLEDWQSKYLVTREVINPETGQKMTVDYIIKDAPPPPVGTGIHGEKVDAKKLQDSWSALTAYQALDFKRRYDLDTSKAYEVSQMTANYADYDQNTYNSYFDIARGVLHDLRVEDPNVVTNAWDRFKAYNTQYIWNPIRSGRFDILGLNTLVNLGETMDFAGTGARAVESQLMPTIKFSKSHLVENQKAWKAKSISTEEQKAIMELGGDLLFSDEDLINTKSYSQKDGKLVQTGDKREDVINKLKDAGLYEAYLKMKADYDKDFKKLDTKGLMDALKVAYTTHDNFASDTGSLAGDIYNDLLFDPTLVIGGLAHGAAKAGTSLASDSVLRRISKELPEEAMKAQSKQYGKTIGQIFSKDLGSKLYSFNTVKDIDDFVDSWAKTVDASEMHTPAMAIQGTAADQYEVLTHQLRDAFKLEAKRAITDTIDSKLFMVCKGIHKIGEAADTLDSFMLKSVFNQPYLTYKVLAPTYSAAKRLAKQTDFYDAYKFKSRQAVNRIIKNATDNKPLRITHLPRVLSELNADGASKLPQFKTDLIKDTFKKQMDVDIPRLAACTENIFKQISALSKKTLSDDELKALAEDIYTNVQVLLLDITDNKCSDLRGARSFILDMYTTSVRDISELATILVRYTMAIDRLDRAVQLANKSFDSNCVDPIFTFVRDSKPPVKQFVSLSQYDLYRDAAEGIEAKHKTHFWGEGQYSQDNHKTSKAKWSVNGKYDPEKAYNEGYLNEETFKYIDEDNEIYDGGNSELYNVKQDELDLAFEQEFNVWSQDLLNSITTTINRLAELEHRRGALGEVYKKVLSDLSKGLNQYNNGSIDIYDLYSILKQAHTQLGRKVDPFDHSFVSKAGNANAVHPELNVYNDMYRCEFNSTTQAELTQCFDRILHLVDVDQLDDELLDFFTNPKLIEDVHPKVILSKLDQLHVKTQLAIADNPDAFIDASRLQVIDEAIAIIKNETGRIDITDTTTLIEFKMSHYATFEKFVSDKNITKMMELILDPDSAFNKRINALDAQFSLDPDNFTKEIAALNTVRRLPNNYMALQYLFQDLELTNLSKEKMSVVIDKLFSINTEGITDLLDGNFENFMNSVETLANTLYGSGSKSLDSFRLNFQIRDSRNIILKNSAYRKELEENPELWDTISERCRGGHVDPTEDTWMQIFSSIMYDPSTIDFYNSQPAVAFYDLETTGTKGYLKDELTDYNVKFWKPLNPKASLSDIIKHIDSLESVTRKAAHTVEEWEELVDKQLLDKMYQNVHDVKPEDRFKHFCENHSVEGNLAEEDLINTLLIDLSSKKLRDTMFVTHNTNNFDFTFLEDRAFSLPGIDSTLISELNNNTFNTCKYMINTSDVNASFTYEEKVGIADSLVNYVQMITEAGTFDGKIFPLNDFDAALKTLGFETTDPDGVLNLLVEGSKTFKSSQLKSSIITEDWLNKNVLDLADEQLEYFFPDSEQREALLEKVHSTREVDRQIAQQDYREQIMSMMSLTPHEYDLYKKLVSTSDIHKFTKKEFLELGFNSNNYHAYMLADYYLRHPEQHKLLQDVKYWSERRRKYDEFRSGKINDPTKPQMDYHLRGAAYKKPKAQIDLAHPKQLNMGNIYDKGLLPTQTAIVGDEFVAFSESTKIYNIFDSADDFPPVTDAEPGIYCVDAGELGYEKYEYNPENHEYVFIGYTHDDLKQMNLDNIAAIDDMQYVHIPELQHSINERAVKAEYSQHEVFSSVKKPVQIEAMSDILNKQFRDVYKMYSDIVSENVAERLVGRTFNVKPTRSGLTNNVAKRQHSVMDLSTSNMFKKPSRRVTSVKKNYTYKGSTKPRLNKGSTEIPSTANRLPSIYEDESGIKSNLMQFIASRNPRWNNLRKNLDHQPSFEELVEAAYREDFSYWVGKFKEANPNIEVPNKEQVTNYISANLTSQLHEADKYQKRVHILQSRGEPVDAEGRPILGGEFVDEEKPSRYIVKGLDKSPLHAIDHIRESFLHSSRDFQMDDLDHFRGLLKEYEDNHPSIAKNIKSSFNHNVDEFFGDDLLNGVKGDWLRLPPLDRQVALNIVAKYWDRINTNGSITSEEVGKLVYGNINGSLLDLERYDLMKRTVQIELDELDIYYRKVLTDLTDTLQSQDVYKAFMASRNSEKPYQLTLREKRELKRLRKQYAADRKQLDKLREDRAYEIRKPLLMDYGLTYMQYERDAADIPRRLYKQNNLGPDDLFIDVDRSTGKLIQIRGDQIVTNKNDYWHTEAQVMSNDSWQPSLDFRARMEYGQNFKSWFRRYVQEHVPMLENKARALFSQDWLDDYSDSNAIDYITDLLIKRYNGADLDPIVQWSIKDIPEIKRDDILGYIKTNLPSDEPFLKPVINKKISDRPLFDWHYEDTDGGHQWTFRDNDELPYDYARQIGNRPIDFRLMSHHSSGNEQVKRTADGKVVHTHLGSSERVARQHLAETKVHKNSAKLKPSDVRNMNLSDLQNVRDNLVSDMRSRFKERHKDNFYGGGYQNYLALMQRRYDNDTTSRFYTKKIFSTEDVRTLFNFNASSGYASDLTHLQQFYEAYQKKLAQSTVDDTVMRNIAPYVRQLISDTIELANGMNPNDPMYFLKDLKIPDSYQELDALYKLLWGRFYFPMVTKSVTDFKDKKLFIRKQLQESDLYKYFEGEHPDVPLDVRQKLKQYLRGDKQFDAIQNVEKLIGSTDTSLSKAENMTDYTLAQVKGDGIRALITYQHADMLEEFKSISSELTEADNAALTYGLEQLRKRQCEEIIDYISTSETNLIKHLLYTHQIATVEKKLCSSDQLAALNKVCTDSSKLYFQNDGKYLHIGFKHNIELEKYFNEKQELQLRFKGEKDFYTRPEYTVYDLNFKDILPDDKSELADRLNALNNRISNLSGGSVKNAMFGSYDVYKHKDYIASLPTGFADNIIARDITLDANLWSAHISPFNILGDYTYRASNVSSLGNALIDNMFASFTDLVRLNKNINNYASSIFGDSSPVRLENVFNAFTTTDKTEFIQMLKNNPDQAVCKLTPNDSNISGFEVVPVTINTERDLEDAFAEGASLIGYDIFTEACDVLNKAAKSNKYLDAWSKLIRVTKVSQICFTGTVLRNIIDAYMKMAIGTGSLIQPLFFIPTAFKDIRHYQETTNNIFDRMSSNNVNYNDHSKLFDHFKFVNSKMSYKEYVFMDQWMNNPLYGGELTSYQKFADKYNLQRDRQAALGAISDDGWTTVGRDDAKFENLDMDTIIRSVNAITADQGKWQPMELDEFLQYLELSKTKQLHTVPKDKVLQYNYTVSKAIAALTKMDHPKPTFMSRIDQLGNKVMTPMTYTEQVIRLAQYRCLEANGFTRSQIFKNITDTQFNYNMKSTKLRNVENIIPFFNFAYMNLKFWCKQIDENPATIHALTQVYTDMTLQNPNYTSDELEDVSLAKSLVSGNIPIGDSGAYFKLSPSWMDAYNIIYGGPGEALSRVYAPIQMGTKYLFNKAGLDATMLFSANDLKPSYDGDWAANLAQLVPYVGPLYGKWYNQRKLQPYKTLKENGAGSFQAAAVTLLPSVFGVYSNYKSEARNKIGFTKATGDLIYQALVNKINNGGLSQDEIDLIIRTMNETGIKDITDGEDSFQQFQDKLRLQGRWYDSNKGKVVKLSEYNEYGLNDPTLKNNWINLCIQQMIKHHKVWDNNVGSFVNFSDYTFGGLNREFDFDKEGEWEEFCRLKRIKQGLIWDNNQRAFVDEAHYIEGFLNDKDLDWDSVCKYNEAFFGTKWDANQGKFVNPDQFIEGGLNMEHMGWSELSTLKYIIDGEQWSFGSHSFEKVRESQVVYMLPASEIDSSKLTVQRESTSFLDKLGVSVYAAGEDKKYGATGIAGNAIRTLVNDSKVGMLKTEDGKYILTGDKAHDAKVFDLILSENSAPGSGRGWRNYKWNNWGFRNNRRVGLGVGLRNQQLIGGIIGRDGRIYQRPYNYNNNKYAGLRMAATGRKSYDEFYKFEYQYNFQYRYHNPVYGIADNPASKLGIQKYEELRERSLERDFRNRNYYNFDNSRGLSGFTVKQRLNNGKLTWWNRY